MKAHLLAAAILTMATACVAVPDDSRVVGDNSRCVTDGLESLVGQPATSGLGAEALRRSHSRGLRWIQPGDAVTMDFRADRLNIRLDANNRVEGFSCG